MKNLNRCLIVVLLIALIYTLNYYQDTINKKNKKDDAEIENFNALNDSSNINKQNIKNNDENIEEQNTKNKKMNIKNQMNNVKNQKNNIKNNVKNNNNFDMSSNGDSLDGISQLELDTFNNSLGSSFVPSIFDESE